MIPRLNPDSSVASSTPELTAAVTSLVEYLTPQLVRWRRDLHQHPELSFREHRTAGYIAEQLAGTGLEISRPTETSVLAVLSTGRPGPTVALRADVDALAVQEDSGLEFASVNPGVMHACGHDGHVAALLGVATVLSRLPGALNGRGFGGEVRFIFQHGEEQVPSGAIDLIDAGIMRDVDVVLGQHLWAPLAVGSVSVRPGPVMASCDYFDITVNGHGGHAGLPHQTVDPLAAAVQIVNSLNLIVSRQTDPLTALVVGVTRFAAGEAVNVVPGTATVSGTIRTLDETVRGSVPKRIERIVQGISAAHGAEATVTFRFGPPVVDNDAELSTVVEAAVVRQLGAAAVTAIPPVMAGDDFSLYQRQAPGVYLLVGAGTPGKDNAPHHHPQFTIDERSIPIAARALSEATVWLCT